VCPPRQLLPALLHPARRRSIKPTAPHARARALRQVGAGIPPALASIRQLVSTQLQAPPELVQVRVAAGAHTPCSGGGCARATQEPAGVQADVRSTAHRDQTRTDTHAHARAHTHTHTHMAAPSLSAGAGSRRVRCWPARRAAVADAWRRVLARRVGRHHTGARRQRQRGVCLLAQGGAPLPARWRVAATGATASNTMTSARPSEPACLCVCLSLSLSVCVCVLPACPRVCVRACPRVCYACAFARVRRCGRASGATARG
jgi:hypothetical protein